MTTKSTLVNGTAGVLASLTPVTINFLGTMQNLDVSTEDSALRVVGLTGQSINPGATGVVVTSGRMLDVPLPFNIGDYVYVSKSGGLQSTLPSPDVDGFVSGDYIIRVGVMAKNDSNPSKKDMFVNISIIGQL